MSPVLAHAMGLELVTIPPIRISSSLLPKGHGITSDTATDLPITGEFGTTAIPFVVATMHSESMILGRAFAVLFATLNRTSLGWLPLPDQIPEDDTEALRFLALVTSRTHSIRMPPFKTELTPRSRPPAHQVNALSVEWTTTTPVQPGRAQCSSLVAYKPTDEPIDIRVNAILATPSTNTEHFLTTLQEHFTEVFSPVITKPVSGPFAFTIDLIEKPFPNNARLRQSPYHLSPQDRLELKLQVQALCKTDMIRESTSPFAAPAFFVPKKNGKKRLCIDYRPLNMITVKDGFPLPRIDDVLDQLSGATIFSTLDLQSGYHQVAISPEDRWKTAFSTPNGLYEWNVLPFGLCNAPAAFQRLMNHVLREFLDDFVCVYLDDIIIFSHSHDEHQRHLVQVFERLHTFNLHVNAEKCHFFQTEVEYLGFLVSANGVRNDPEKIRAIQEWPNPRSVKDVQAFLGAVNYMRRSLAGCAATALPLHRLTHKDTPFQWTPECDAAFTQLKADLTSAPTLLIPDVSKPFFLSTDASDIAIGAVLQQLSGPPGNEILKPVAYESKKLKGAETRWVTREKECFAIIHALQKWRHYLLAAPVYVLTDHQSLRFILSQSTVKGRIARWLYLLADYDLHIGYRPGPENGMADRLSRPPNYQDGYQDEDDDVAPPAAISLPTLAVNALQAVSAHTRYRSFTPLDFTPEVLDFIANSFQTALDPDTAEDEVNNPTILTLYAALSRGLDPPESVQHLQKDYYYDNDLRLLIFTPGTEPSTAAPFVPNLVIPDNSTLEPTLFPPGLHLRRCLIDIAHSTPLASHRGAVSTYVRIRARYYWPKMRTDVESFCHGCLPCQVAKPTNRRPYGLLRSLPIPHRPWVALSMDFITALPPSGPRQYDSLFVVVDRFSKAARFLPCHKTADAPLVAKFLLQEVVYRNGVPQFIVSDRGPQFTSAFWTNLASALGITCQFSTAYHPQTDGQTERVNRVIAEMLRITCRYNPHDWANYIAATEFSYNSSYHHAVGMSPLQAERGYSPLMPPTFENDAIRHNGRDMPDFYLTLRAHHWYVRDALAKAQSAQAKQFNKKRRRPDFAVDDLVLVSRKAFGDLQRYDRSLPLYYGPCRVVKIGTPSTGFENVVEVDAPLPKKRRRYNVAWLKHFNPSGCRFRNPPPHNGNM